MNWLTRITFGKSIKLTLVRASLIALLAIFVFRFLLIPIRLQGGSMEPTYKNRSFIFVNTLKYRCRNLHRGDIVIIKMAGTRVMLMKRVLALPGESIAFSNGTLIVNKRPVTEPYLSHKGNWNMEEMIVGTGEYYVAGDNRQVPLRMHNHGRVNLSRIIGGPLL